jgi:hypothetical protein
MKLQNARIVEMLGRHVVIADNAVANGGLSPRGCTLSRRGRQPAEMAIVTWSAERAKEILETETLFLGCDTTMRRTAGNRRIAARLKPRRIVYDGKGDGDDARIKEENPPPAGIDVSFHWGADGVLRVEAVTMRNDEIATKVLVVDTDEGGDVGAEIDKVYERLSRIAPAPEVEQGLRCATHVAALVAGLDAPACAHLAWWCAMVAATPRTRRGQLAELRLPAATIDPSMLYVVMKAAKGRDLVETSVQYKHGAVIDGQVIKFRGELPETALSALQGRTAEAIWGDGRLRSVTLGEHKGTTIPQDGSPQHVFGIATTSTAIPVVDNHTMDDDAAATVLRRVYAGYTFDAGLRVALAALSPAWLLHVLRSAFYGRDKTVDLDFAPGLAGVRVMLAGKHLRIERQGSVQMSTILP